MYYNYILYNDLNNTTYNGYTTNLERRLKQHNGIIKGGARSTKKNAGHWKFLATVKCECDLSTAMSFEWWVRYPEGKKPRSRIYMKPDGRLLGLLKVLERFQFSLDDVWVDANYSDTWAQQLANLH